MIAAGPIVWQTKLVLIGNAAGNYVDVPAGVFPPVVFDGRPLRVKCRLPYMKMASQLTPVGLVLVDNASGKTVYDERTPAPALNTPFTVVCESEPFVAFSDGSLLVPGTSYVFKLRYGIGVGTSVTVTATYGGQFKGHATLYREEAA